VPVVLKKSYRGCFCLHPRVTIGFNHSSSRPAGHGNNSLFCHAAFEELLKIANDDETGFDVRFSGLILPAGLKIRFGVWEKRNFQSAALPDSHSWRAGA
jgi:hypothetical protein